MRSVEGTRKTTSNGSVDTSVGPIVAWGGMCWICIAGSGFWCGFPCIPIGVPGGIPGGPLEPIKDDTAVESLRRLSAVAMTSNFAGNLTASDHTLVMKELYRLNKDVIRIISTREDEAGLKRNPEDVLMAMLQLQKLDPRARDIIRQVVEYHWMVMGIPKTQHIYAKVYRIAMRRMRKAASIKEIISILSSFTNHSRLNRFEGISTGIETAVDIIKDGMNTIYNPESQEANESSLGGSILNIAAHDAVGALAGAAAGAIAGAVVASGPGAGGGAIMGGVVSSANTAFDEAVDALEEDGDTETVDGHLLTLTSRDCFLDFSKVHQKGALVVTNATT